MNMNLQKQHGLTLIELMIALVISLIILVGLITIYQSSNRANRTSEGLVRVQENGRFAIDFLIRDLRMAGFPAIDTNIHNQVGGTDGGANLPDSLTINNNTGFDCMGQAVGAPAIVTNTYTIANTARLNRQGNLIPALFCTSANGTFELVEGIENMQVLYGVDTDSSRDGVPNRYVAAGSVTAWERVVTVRIALLASSVDEFSSGTSNRVFRMLGLNIGPFADNMIRREYTTTTVLENYLYDY